MKLSDLILEIEPQPNDRLSADAEVVIELVDLDDREPYYVDIAEIEITTSSAHPGRVILKPGGPLES